MPPPSDQTPNPFFYPCPASVYTGLALFCLSVLHFVLLSQHGRHAHINTHTPIHTHRHTYKDTHPKTRQTYHVVHTWRDTHTHQTVSEAYKQILTNKHTHTHTHTQRYLSVIKKERKSVLAPSIVPIVTLTPLPLQTHVLTFYISSYTPPRHINRNLCTHLLSPVRFRPKTRHLRFTRIWAHRPSIKGSKLLFPVIKANQTNYSKRKRKRERKKEDKGQKWVQEHFTPWAKSFLETRRSRWKETTDATNQAGYRGV